VIVPRRAGPAFAPTRTVTVAALLPLPFDVIAIQFESLTAVHEQPVRVSIATLNPPPAAETAVLVGETM